MGETIITHKVPNQATSGSETFSDPIVGLQITNGTNQLTNANFEMDKVISEKDSKSFSSEPFSEFLSLDDIKEEEYVDVVNDTNSTTKKNQGIIFNKSKEYGDVSLYGSLKDRLRVTITNIMKKYPGGLYIDTNTPSSSTPYSAFNSVYNGDTNTTKFETQHSNINNPFDLTLIKSNSGVISDTDKNIRNFVNSYTKYVMVLSGMTYDIVYYSEPTNGIVKFRVIGDCFNGLIVNQITTGNTEIIGNTTTHPRWDDSGSSTIYGTDKFGFSARPGGYRDDNYGSFGNVGSYGNWWSSTEDDASDAYFRYLNCSYSFVIRVSNTKSYGFSVRCVSSTDPGVPTITDADNNIYDVIKIGTQWWLKQNLSTTKYNDGVSIPNITDGTSWGIDDEGAYCWYNNDISNKDNYGALYNWHAVNTGKLAPASWRVATDNDWTVLVGYLISSGGTVGYMPSHPDVDITSLNVGDALKSIYQIGSPMVKTIINPPTDTGVKIPILIRPNNGQVEEFFNSLDDLESILLNRDVYPKYTSTFTVMTDDNIPETQSVTWPTSYDGWNLSTNGLEFSMYVNDLSNIGINVDEYKSNLIIRFLTSPQLFEFDTIDKKIEAIFQIYGQSFDMVKKYIDNIAYMRNVTYDGINNIPDTLLQNLVETLGLTPINLHNETLIENTKYTRNDSVYGGLTTGLNIIESETEIYRRLANNLVYLYKSKGTRKTIEFLLKFIGAPEQMIVINENIYKIDGELPSNNIESDINEVITTGKKTYIATIYSGGTTYTATTVNNISTLYRAQYPVDEITGLPRKYETTDGSVGFQIGAGWNKKTLNHRSSDMLDVENSDLISKIKVVKTKSKPFTHGEDYFNNFRKLPGLNYGYNLISEVDNSKTKNVTNIYDSKKIMNRKNLEVFLSASKVIEYDVFRKFTNTDIINDITPYIFEKSGYFIMDKDGDAILYKGDTEIIKISELNKLSFEEFNNMVNSFFIKNTDVMKYDKNYHELDDVMTVYQGKNTYKPFTHEMISDYIHNLSPNWLDLIEQFIPATTLWVGGNLIENTKYTRQKYQHIKNRDINKQNT